MRYSNTTLEIDPSPSPPQESLHARHKAILTTMSNWMLTPDGRAMDAVLVILLFFVIIFSTDGMEEAPRNRNQIEAAQGRTCSQKRETVQGRCLSPRSLSAGSPTLHCLSTCSPTMHCLSPRSLTTYNFPRIALPCIAFPCVALPCVALSCIALPCIALPRVALLHAYLGCDSNVILLVHIVAIFITKIIFLFCHCFSTFHSLL